MDIIDVKEELKKFKVNYIYFYPCLEKPKIVKKELKEIKIIKKKLKELKEIKIVEKNYG